MSFVSVSFLIFYLFALGLRFTIGRTKQGELYFYSLLLLSALFYGWQIPQYLPLLFLSCSINALAALWISRTPTENKRLRLVALSLAIILNLGILALFKYTVFFFDLLLAAGFPPAPDGTRSFWETVVLPIGISFYTFQAMSYTIDVYRGHFQPVPFTRFCLYVGFFPQLVAGPIVRARQLIYQFNRRRRLNHRVFFEGTYLIIRGLFLKIVVADNLGMIIDKYWNLATTPQASMVLTFSLVFFFSCQLLCDFMGYTDIARGIAYHLGFRLPINFNGPYLAASFSSFWKRWHITLSQWMRDYLYISFGGNRKGKWLTIFNLFLVMVIAGLWHGASMNFVLWGALHGLAITIERLLGISGWIKRFEKNTLPIKPLQSIPIFFWFLVVQLTWLVGMAVFRAENGAESLVVLTNLYQGLFTFSTATELRPDILAALKLGYCFTLPVVLLHLRIFISEWAGYPTSNRYERALYTGVMLFCLVSLYATHQPFIYFQF